MEADFLVASDLLKGGRVLRWLVKEGTKVNENQPIADIFAPSKYTGQMCKQHLQAPISGKLVKLCAVQPAPAVAAGPSAPTDGAKSLLPTAQASSAMTLATIKYCTHSVIYNNMCAICASEMSRLPPRTKALWEDHQAKSNAAKASAGSGTASSAKRSREGNPLAVGAAASSSGPGAGIPHGMTQVKIQHGYELTVSAAHAADADTAILSRLRSQRKLCLVLDLDHTLVHATNDERAAGVASDPRFAGQVFSWIEGPVTYRIKTRPFLQEFLEEASKLYELQVDTAGTRAYATMVVDHIDPHRRFFGDRLVTRSDSSLKHKQTQWMHRAIHDDSMIIIVDDTTDVWRGSKNLLTVEPYLFWHTVSEAELNNKAGRSMIDTGAHATPHSYAPPPKSSASSSASSPSSSASKSTVTLGNDSPTGAINADGQSGAVALSTLASPSLDAAASAHISPAASVSSTSSAGSAASTGKPVFVEESHHYLADILRVLKDIHSEYYRQYDEYTAAFHHHRHEAAAAGSSSSAASTSTATRSASAVSASVRLPSVPQIMQSYLRSILSETCLVFSGVFPLGAHADRSNLWRRVVTYGAGIADNLDSTRCRANLVLPEQLDHEVHAQTEAMRAARQASASSSADQPSDGGGGAAPSYGSVHTSAAAYDALQRYSKPIVTHVVARSGGTAKTKAGAADPEVRVVPLAWLEQCVLQYRRLPETAFSEYLPGYEKHANRPQEKRVANLQHLRKLALEEAVARKMSEVARHAEEQEASSSESEASDEEPAAPSSNHHHDQGKRARSGTESSMSSHGTSDEFGAELEAAFAEAYKHAEGDRVQSNDDDDHDGHDHHQHNQPGDGNHNHEHDSDHSDDDGDIALDDGDLSDSGSGHDDRAGSKEADEDG